MDALVHSILSYNKDIVMLAAILSLLLVVLFIFMLHIYARCFLTQAPMTSDGVSASAPVVPLALGSRFYRLHNLFTSHGTDSNNDHDLSHATKGLESSVISSIPQFVFRAEEQGGKGLACVICLSLFGGEEVGRKLARCNHCFHVECIDMWLHSHTTCPICRAPAVPPADDGSDSIVAVSSSVLDHERDRNEGGYGELLDSTSNIVLPFEGLGEESRDTSHSPRRNSSRLEIIVEVPGANDELGDIAERKIHMPSNVC